MELKEYLEMSTVPDFFFLWEVEEREISYLSPSFKNLGLMGLSKEDMVRELIHPDSVEYFDLVMEKLPDLNYRIDEEIKANAQKFDIEWLRLKTFPFYKENVVYKVAVQFTYVKKQKSSLAESRKGEENKEGMMEAVIQDLWGTVSNIISFAKIMETELKEQRYSDFENYISNIIKIGFETKDVLSTVLTLREIEKGNQTLSLEKVNFKEFILSNAPNLKEKFQKFNIRLNFDFPDEAICSEIDKGRFYQVFSSIVSNLAKSTNPGGSIKISMEAGDGNAIISICNIKGNENGDNSARRFDNMQDYYIQPEHDIENPSGLEITRKIIELHKGKIWMENMLGKGSTYYIELPLC